MKRTLTAATAVVVSSAGAIGFAGTAAAVDTPDSPANLPVENPVAQTATQGVAAVHSVVGDVVPAEQAAPKAAPPVEKNPVNATVSHLLGGDGPSGIPGALPQGQTTVGQGDPSSSGNTVAGLPVGDVVPAQQPEGRSGDTSAAQPVTDMAQSAVSSEGPVGSIAKGVQSLGGAAAPQGKSGDPVSDTLGGVDGGGVVAPAGDLVSSLAG